MRKLIWKPTESYIKSSTLYSFQQYVEHTYNRCFLDYESFHSWSIAHSEKLWEAVLNYFEISFSGSISKVIDWDKNDSDFIKAKWFPGLFLSYSEHIFKGKKPDDIALKYCDESGNFIEIYWLKLTEKVSVFQQYMRENGLQKGDRVAAILNNTVDSIALFLAANSLGAIWSCCSPDFGDQSVKERFEQIEPKMLFMETEYTYNGKTFYKKNTLDFLHDNLPYLDHIIDLNSDDFIRVFKGYNPAPLFFERVAFDDPIWILYSSGTTGKPKAITHRSGGNLLEHFKALALHQNVLPGENFLWYTTTGWMMWNYALSSLLCGATLCLYNGAIQFDEHQSFWRFVRRAQVDHLGAGASYFSSIMDLDIPDYQPKVIGSTGSPLTTATFENLQAKFPNTHIISLSGGTDVCSAFLSGCAYKEVYAGEIQCRTLAADIVAINENDVEVLDAVGELVIKQPMPSMPLYFWNDKHDERYRASYFETSNNQRNGKALWRHGDWIQIKSDGGILMHGRSDATLNKGGVRIGTAEIYNVVDRIPGVIDSLAIGLTYADKIDQILLFIQLGDGHDIDVLVPLIKQALRQTYSARHVPDLFYAVPEIPYTLSGKKLEIPVRKLFSGLPLEKAVSMAIMRNPDSLAAYVELAKLFNS